MTQNEMTAAAIAVFIGFAVLRGIFRMLRGLAGGNSGQMERINAAAKRVLAEQQQPATRSSVPVTQGKRPAPKQRHPAKIQAPKKQQRQHQQNQPRSQAIQSARPFTTGSAVTRRTGLLSGGSEPVIQRRR